MFSSVITLVIKCMMDFNCDRLLANLKDMPAGFLNFSLITWVMQFSYYQKNLIIVFFLSSSFCFLAILK